MECVTLHSQERSHVCLEGGSEQWFSCPLTYPQMSLSGPSFPLLFHPLCPSAVPMYSLPFLPTTSVSPLLSHGIGTTGMGPFPFFGSVSQLCWPSQGPYNIVYDNYRQSQQYCGIMQLACSDSPAIEALAWPSTPALPPLNQIAPAFPTKSIAMMTRKWSKLSSYECMEHYNMAHRYLTFEQQGQMMVQWSELIRDSTQIKSQSHYCTTMQRPQFTGGPKTVSNSNSPNTCNGNQGSVTAPSGAQSATVQFEDLAEAALREYIDIMETLGSGTGSDLLQEEEDKEEDSLFFHFESEYPSFKTNGNTKLTSLL